MTEQCTTSTEALTRLKKVSMLEEAEILSGKDIIKKKKKKKVVCLIFSPTDELLVNLVFAFVYRQRMQYSHFQKDKPWFMNHDLYVLIFGSPDIGCLDYCLMLLSINFSIFVMYLSFVIMLHVWILSWLYYPFISAALYQVCCEFTHPCIRELCMYVGMYMSHQMYEQSWEGYF